MQIWVQKYKKKIRLRLPFFQDPDLGIAFFEKVRSGYLDLSQNEPNRIKVLDAKKSINDLHKDIVSFVEIIL